MVKPTLAVLKFGATWCESCHDIKKDFDDISNSYDIPFKSLDLDKYTSLADYFNIESLPTFVVAHLYPKHSDTNPKLVKKFTGTNLQPLRNFLDGLVSKPKRKRCPNGTRKNKKTGNCDPKLKSSKTILIPPSPSPSPSPIIKVNPNPNRKRKIIEDTPTPTPKKKTPKKTKRKRCPNGTRKNKKTGNCEPNLKTKITPKSTECDNFQINQRVAYKQGIPGEVYIVTELRPKHNKIVIRGRINPHDGIENIELDCDRAMWDLEPLGPTPKKKTPTPKKKTPKKKTPKKKTPKKKTPKKKKGIHPQLKAILDEWMKRAPRPKSKKLSQWTYQEVNKWLVLSDFGGNWKSLDGRALLRMDRTTFDAIMTITEGVFDDIERKHALDEIPVDELTDSIKDYIWNSIQKTFWKTRCPKGTRKNKTTGQCELVHSERENRACQDLSMCQEKGLCWYVSALILIYKIKILYDATKPAHQKFMDDIMVCDLKQSIFEPGKTFELCKRLPTDITKTLRKTSPESIKALNEGAGELSIHIIKAILDVNNIHYLTRVVNVFDSWRCVDHRYTEKFDNIDQLYADADPTALKHVLKKKRGGFRVLLTEVFFGDKYCPLPGMKGTIGGTRKNNYMLRIVKNNPHIVGGIVYITNRKSVDDDDVDKTLHSDHGTAFSVCHKKKEPKINYCNTWGDMCDMTGQNVWSSHRKYKDPSKINAYYILFLSIIPVGATPPPGGVPK
jgi:thiol-disulfide isomerase/thioredoxin